MKIKYIILLLFVCVCLSSCFNDDVPTPKPKTYFRLDVPIPTYQKFDTLGLPFIFQYPNYGIVETVEGKFADRNWFNINFPNYGCKLYVSFKYLTPKVTLDSLINDSYNFTKKYDKFSSGILETAYANNKSKVYGYVFEIKGTEVVSPYQFYVTDSSRYFLRGALYFEFKPNNDSLAPIIKRLTIDLNNMISTFEWK